jgi:CheY-like chemotaxis protein
LTTRHKRAQGGLGIGLALAKSLIELHGGRIEVRSEGEGRGSEFIVRLPLAIPQLSTADNSDSDHYENSLVSCSRVLVVDDNEDAASTLAMVLSVRGCEVQIANDGPAALKAIQSFHPAVVLLDLGMPVMSGFEVAQHVRTMFAGREPVLVAVTGWGQEEDRRRTSEAGFSYHLVKPIEIRALDKIFSEINSSANGASVLNLVFDFAALVLK